MNEKAYIQVCVKLRNNVVVPKLVEKYNISNRKTYEPPDFSTYNLNNELWMSLILGLIDGDGCIHIRKSGECYGRIRLHSNWFGALCYLKQTLCGVFGLSVVDPIIEQSGFVGWTLTHTMLWKLREFALSKSLPLLARKWDIREPISVAVLNEDLVRMIRTSETNTKDLAKELGIAYQTLYYARTGRTWRHIHG
jgi:hypothetical protein